VSDPRNPGKVVVAVAPVAHHADRLPPEAKNPLTSREVAEEALRCAEAGAALVHLHVRDNQGNQTGDLDVFGETVDRIRGASDIIIQGSTGGLSTLTLEERCVCLREPRVEMASLNLGSVNFGETVYINTLPDIRYWARRMKETHTHPELEIFNPSMIETALELLESGDLEPPLRFGFALGFHSSLQADPRHLPYLVGMIPEGSPWGVVHEGMESFTFVASALGLGADLLRVGYEDGGYFGNRRPAATNAVLVEALVDLVRRGGREIATPEEARRMLSISPLGTAADSTDTGGVLPRTEGTR
jgi:3-keto-5-aminohexanoate cleavage enzyme